MPMKTCPQCSEGVGVRTLKCKCGFEFHPKVVAAPPSIPRPQAQVALPDAQVGTTDCDYKGLEGTRPIAIIRLTADALSSLTAGRCVPAVLHGREVYLEVQVQRGE
jgi:hypothetical protein